MSVTKVINVEVQSGDLNQLNSDLQKVEKSFKKVEKEADKTTQELKEIGDNGGAIAILDELTGGLATKLRDAGEASKLFNFSLKGTRKALIATGIGAFVVALGTVVAYWDEIIDFIKGANTELEKQKRIIEQIGNELDRQKFNNELNLELIALQTEQDVKRAKLAGKTEKEITEIRKQGIKNRITELENAAKIALELEREAATVGGEEFEKAQKKRIELEKAASNERIALVNFELDQEIKAREKADKNSGKREKQKSVTDLSTNEEQKSETQKLQSQFEELFGIKKMQQKQLDDLGKAGVEESLKNIDVVAAAQKKSDDDTVKNKKILAEQELALIATTAGQAAQILGENTAAGKAFAVAQALINTYQGITNVWSEKSESGLVGAGLVQRIATTAIVAAQGFAAVKDILSVKVPGGFSGGAGGNTTGSRGGAPAFNVVGTSGVNQLAESLQQDQQPVQAFVVGSNVTSQQALDRNITETATLG